MWICSLKLTISDIGGYSVCGGYLPIRDADKTQLPTWLLVVVWLTAVLEDMYFYILCVRENVVTLLFDVVTRIAV